MTQVHHRKFIRDCGGKDGGGGNSTQLAIYTNTPVDDQFSSPKQIRWSAALGKLLVGNLIYSHIRNADLSFSEKINNPRLSHGVDSDTNNIYSVTLSDFYKHTITSLRAGTNYVSTFGIASLRMLDASGDPLHVYVTSNNTTDDHGIRMITKSTMAVTGGGTPVQILATGTGDNQFTNPLGILYVATNADSGFLYVCEATRICKIAVVTTAGSESFTWNTSYAIAANDLAWDGTNFYAQSSTQTIKYDNVFTDATKVATACVGYSITYIPDQGDGNGATLAIVDSTNSHLERRKCSDLSAINSVGSAGDGLSSKFDPVLTTSVATQVEFKMDDGWSYVTALGTTHAILWNGFDGYSFRSAGPHKCTITVRGGLGRVTGIDCTVDSIVSLKNLLKCANTSSFLAYTNTDIAMDLLQVPRQVTIFYAQHTSITGNTKDLPTTLLNLDLHQSGVVGSLAETPFTNIQTMNLFICPGITAASIAHLVAIRDLRIHSMGWLTADVDLVLKSISDAIHLDVNHFTYATPALQIGGTNQAPSHLDGWYDPIAVHGAAGPGDGVHWEWDAVTSTYKALSGGAAIWAANHAAGHPWTITYNGGISEDSLLGNVIGTGEKSWASANTNTIRYWQKFTAVAGTIGDIRIKSVGSSNVKVAIYSDNASYPNALLAYSASTATVAGWNTIQLNVQVALTATSYWLCFQESVGYIQRVVTGGTTLVLNPATYGNAFANPAPVGLEVAASDYAIAGWGLKVV